MVLFPQLIGGVEIEERRPRYWNEPRRKRLQFVKSRSYRPDEWALVQSSHHRQTETDLWDQRQFEANQRFWNQEEIRLRQRAARIHQDQQRHMICHPPPLHALHQGHDPRIQQLPAPPPDHGGHHDRNDRRSHHGHDDDDDPIVAICTSSDDSDDDDCGPPRLIEIAPKKDKLPKYFKKVHRSKSRGRKGKKNKHPPASIFSSDDSDSDSDDNFTQGFYAGRRSLSRRPLSRRGRSRSRMFELSDDSFEDLEFRPRARSSSRGPKLLYPRRR